MTVLLRQTIAAVTALSVLVCSLLCACPATATTAHAHGQAASSASHTHGDRSAHAHHAAHQDRAAAHDSTSGAPCHSKAPPANDTDGEVPAEPCHDGGNGHGCGHCDGTSLTKPDTNVVQLAPVLTTHFVSPLFDLTVVPPAPLRPLPAATTGVPPPAEWSTLLRLHCALTI